MASASSLDETDHAAKAPDGKATSVAKLQFWEIWPNNDFFLASRKAAAGRAPITSL